MDRIGVARSHASRRRRLAPAFLALALSLAARPGALAQELEPRAYSLSP